jgi:hypothetical protein
MLLTVMLLSGCSYQSNVETTQNSDKYYCVTDQDCLNSCSQGAVNAEWYQQQAGEIQECDGGCDILAMNPPRCLDNVCTAFLQGKNYQPCTKKPATE